MKYIFWDFNGTILDDVKLCLDILNEMLDEEKRDRVSMDQYLHLFTFPIRDYYDRVFDLKTSDFNELAHRFIKRYQPRSLNCKLHEYVTEMITYFKDKGYVNILLSASEEKNLFEQLKHFDIEHLFTHVLGTSNIYAKSKIEVAKNFINKMNIDVKEALMIGDTLHDYEVAKTLGMGIILYSRGHQHQDLFKGHQVIDDFQTLKELII